MLEACRVLTIKLRNTPYMYLKLMNIHTRYTVNFTFATSSIHETILKKISTNISFLISFSKTLLAFRIKKRWGIFLCLKTEIPSRVVKYISQRQRPILYVSCMYQYLERHHHSLFLSSSRPQGKPFFDQSASRS